jgi:FAD/FMN-containing dehydrogenase
MPCPAPAFTGRHVGPWPFVNWSSRVRGSVGDYFEPADLPSLVKVVADASQAGRHVRVVGSLWSMEDIAFSPDIVIGLQSIAPPNPRILAEALRPDWRALQQATEGDKLVHVHSGLTIEGLNTFLKAQTPPLAMKTLGGANGQTLGGAIATGTHGGDIDMPPIGEMVMAIHLVAADGRQIWIERSSDPVTSQPELARLLNADCADTRIFRDDTLFNATLVSMGRFGVVYSCILRVTRAFSIAEWTTIQPWTSVRQLLKAGVDAGTFLTPLLDSLPAPPSALEAYDIRAPLGLEIVINTIDPPRCFVKRRWGTSSQLPPIAAVPGDDAICALGTGGVLALVNSGLDTAIGAAVGGVFLDPIGGTIALTTLIVAKTKFNADLAAIPNFNIGDIIALAFNTLWDAHLDSLIEPVETAVFNARYSDTLTTGKRGPADLIKTGSHTGNQQACYRADSVEPAFNASLPGYIDYLDNVMGALPNYKQAGYISLRYCATSRALLSQHHFAGTHAVSIEVSSVRSLKDNASWMNFIELACLEHGGRPHWGQINESSLWLCYETPEAMLAALPPAYTPPWMQYVTRDRAQKWAIYGESLAQWRAALAFVQSGKTTFSSNFTQKRFLEPIASTVPMAPLDPDALSPTMIAVTALLLD